ncbi:MAG: permease-like cell division protein FtsX [Alkalibacterium sp.]|uniref:Cell division protein FtsX n=1 Tax=Alkalibacterium gilvum TaxID=1130080 RepID=A0A1H6T262_9LACT|nr:MULTISPECIES: permease-like cell division protein FtsX [Alkalibacterium]MDN5907767.1 permease-like cell division protein FtsX [Staphylococcus equorum]MDN6293017.1 permease-like cell division protein FtsX [Alkalibacterium sp.]MDN6294962.1 permease-like cell division protein FtsX [Alkalibacterium sp.]MDN6327646.1 permease-like cell division protein FtsX [Alkalibacterium sp.]MDN6397517.1 permease-like cell division protein FtsX [Alkalibacterium sp.]
MRIRTIGRHIKESFKSIIRNGWMTFAAVSAVAITLLLVGSLIALLMNVNKLASDVEEDVSVRVYIATGSEKEERDALESDLEKIENVEDIEFRSREKELDDVMGSYGEEFGLFEGDDNPLHDVFVLNTSEPEFTSEVAAEAEEIGPIVDDVNYGGAEADRLFEIMDTVRNVGAIIIGALIFTAIFLISNTIRITIFSRRTEIEIMKLVGATNWFIRWPFLIEGALIGFVGALIPVSIISYIYISGFDTIMNFLSGTYFSLLPPNPFLIQIVGLLLTIGVVIGSIGSALSIRKFLKI